MVARRSGWIAFFTQSSGFRIWRSRTVGRRRQRRACSLPFRLLLLLELFLLIHQSSRRNLRLVASSLIHTFRVLPFPTFLLRTTISDQLALSSRNRSFNQRHRPKFLASNGPTLFSLYINLISSTNAR